MRIVVNVVRIVQLLKLHHVIPVLLGSTQAPERQCAPHVRPARPPRLARASVSTPLVRLARIDRRQIASDVRPARTRLVRGRARVPLVLQVRLRRVGARRSLHVYRRIATQGLLVQAEARALAVSLENTRRPAVVRHAPTAGLEPTPRA